MHNNCTAFVLVRIKIEEKTAATLQQFKRIKQKRNRNNFDV